MVGLVLVSHSQQLAKALVSLVQQVSINPIPIAIAAGIGDNRDEFGTDAIEIMSAVQSVYSEDGVLILMDLGSAVLSSKMAFEFLEPEVVNRVRICPAPFVEGAIAAAVQIGLGGQLNAVYQEAMTALSPKEEQLVDSESNSDIPKTDYGVDETINTDTSTIILTLRNLHGLHARPAARFVQLASNFNCEIKVKDLTNGKGPVLARSLNAITTLGAIENHQIEVSANGQQAMQALDAIQALVEDNFGEPLVTGNAPTPILNSLKNKIIEPDNINMNNYGNTITPISEGIAIGPLYHYHKPLPQISQDLIADPEAEWLKFESAVNETRTQIRQRRSQLTAILGDANAAIFDAHDLILADPDLLDATHQIIRETMMNAAYAWDQATESLAQRYRQLSDEYLQQRAIDIEDIKIQVLNNLAGNVEDSQIELSDPVILYADELTPTETSNLDMSKILGILTSKGGPTSHSAILSRALGIPAISGVSVAVSAQPAGTLVALDGSVGQIWINPDTTLTYELNSRREDWLTERQRLVLASKDPAKTKDGHRVEVFANAGNVQDIKMARENGAEGIGLLRTEFLFLTRQAPPTEDEQAAIFEQVGAQFTNVPITIRTLDVGGDKEVPFIQLPSEANPFLGVRAIRLSLREPGLFLPQLRSILRSAIKSNFRIMFPMIATLEELIEAKNMLSLAHDQLKAENIPHCWPIETGIMVEVPSSAMLSPLLAKYVDFFSIGTNDLTQYTMAADRGNPNLTTLSDAFHPSVLKLIKMVIDAAHSEGKWVGVCGELAGEPLAAPILIGLGVDELSMNPAGIPKIKSTIARLTVAETATLAARALLAPNGDTVRDLVTKYFEEIS